MKEDRYTGVICRRACSFYKPGKETMRCAGYDFLARHFTERELNVFPVPQPAHSHQLRYDHLKHPEIAEQLCRKCAFRKGGCDFAENCSGPPCGGYRIVHGLWLP